LEEHRPFSWGETGVLAIEMDLEAGPRRVLAHARRAGKDLRLADEARAVAVEHVAGHRRGAVPRPAEVAALPAVLGREEVVARAQMPTPAARQQSEMAPLRDHVALRSLPARARRVRRDPRVGPTLPAPHISPMSRARQRSGSRRFSSMETALTRQEGSRKLRVSEGNADGGSPSAAGRFGA
jgi:hypothetical protein